MAWAPMRPPAAVARIYAVKGRPSSHPVIVHIGGLWSWTAGRARSLRMRRPRGAVLAGSPDAGAAPCERRRRRADGGQDTIGLRVPGHPVALKLLREFGGGIAAPSANRFGRISPTTADHVRNDLGSDVDLFLDGGACQIGLESTIVDVSRGMPVLLRPGRIGASEIADAIGVAPRLPTPARPRAPGTLEAHYAPRRPLRLVPPHEWNLRDPSRCGVMSFRARPAEATFVAWIRTSSDPERYGHDLYANLRALDASECEEILVEEPPSSAEWSAIRDRLTRARSS